MNTQLIIQIAVVAIVVIIFIAWLAWKIKKNGLRGTVVNMIVKAEDMYNHGANEEKINYVIDKIIALIPVPFSFFITRNTVRKFIQNIFDEIKNALDYTQSKKEG